jgi:hypothetical protein
MMLPAPMKMTLNSSPLPVPARVLKVVEQDAGLQKIEAHLSMGTRSWGSMDPRREGGRERGGITSIRVKKGDGSLE